MGVLACQFMAGTNAATYGLSGTETFDLVGLDEHVKPGQSVMLIVHRANGEVVEVPLTLRLDTPMAVREYARQSS